MLNLKNVICKCHFRQGLYAPSGLGAGKPYWGEGGSEYRSKLAASMTQTWVKREKMDGWTDGWTDGLQTEDYFPEFQTPRVMKRGDAGDRH